MSSQTTAVQQQGNQQVQQRPTRPIDNIRNLLEAAKPKLAEVTPKHLTPDRLMRVAIATMSRTPKLLECSPASLLNSVMQAAQLGLEPGSALGECYLVPYKTTCQLIVGYRGLISLARRSGQIASIEAHVVHAKDKFNCRYGIDAKLDHEPDWSDDPGPMVAVYAVAKLVDGSVQTEVMTKAQVDAIRKRSMSANNGPWVTDYNEMARKTVVRRICKYLPLSIEMAEALALEDGDEVNVVDLPPAEGGSKTEAVKARLAARLGQTGPSAEERAAAEDLVAQAAAEAEAAAAPAAGDEPGSGG